MFGEARNTKKDVLADLITTKHDLQSCIQDVSLCKARIADSEAKVKDDVRRLFTKLQQMVKKMFEGATHAASTTAQAERVRLNEEIIALEDHYKSVEEMEQNVKTNASNTNLRPLKEGKDKCEEATQIIEQHKENMVHKRLQFVLHPLLAYLIRQIETFSMGEVKVMPLEDVSDAAEALDTVGSSDTSTRQRNPKDLPRKKSATPERTTFMRSNSSKLIQMASRANSTLSTKSTKSRRRESLKTDTVPLPKQEERKSLLITKRNVKAKTDIEPREEVAMPEDPDQLVPMTGLSATLAKRSTSAPIISDLPNQDNVAKEGVTEVISPLLDIKYQSTMTTKAHKTPCFITGVTSLVNGNFVVCDSVHDSLQLFDAELNCISEIELTHPWGVTAVSDDAVAASLNFDRKVVLVKAETVLERLSDKEISLKCEASLLYDVKYSVYRLYCLCADGDVHVVDLKGRQYGCIKTGIPNGVQKYLEVNETARCLYTSGERGVVCMTFDGLPLWHFRLGKMSFAPTGIAMYKGLLLVLDWENNGLVEVLMDGQGIRTLTSEGLEKPVGLCPSHNGEKLLISQADYEMSREKTRAVKIFACPETNSDLGK